MTVAAVSRPILEATVTATVFILVSMWIGRKIPSYSDGNVCLHLTRMSWQGCISEVFVTLLYNVFQFEVMMTLLGTRRICWGIGMRNSSMGVSWYSIGEWLHYCKFEISSRGVTISFEWGLLAKKSRSIFEDTHGPRVDRSPTCFVPCTRSEEYFRGYNRSVCIITHLI